ncbi:hypothetical protein [Terriglobus sp. TAA 43]|uniref:hypothetical protein n=1 Tax=Terriglobus sp. TAA 43 TaxID=278961 RepID=UPI00068C576B|nr:hypothetical protein [Terriglobus sp. TAA 43]
MFVFNRPATTQRVFRAVAQARPRTLLLVADGPRLTKVGEAEACEQVRSIVNEVDWQCDVKTNFSDSNLGCQERIISGLDWVFSLVEEAIILEDDCLPAQSFFPFCQELLERYRHDNRIAAISGTNLVQNYVTTSESYYFSQLGGIWGWATWKEMWQRYDRDLNDWPRFKAGKKLHEIFSDNNVIAYWTDVFDTMYAKENAPNTWDYQWIFSCLKNNSLIAMPRVNQVTNIGFGVGATHTQSEDERLIQKTTELEFPLIHPLDFVPMRSLDRRFLSLYRQGFLQRIRNRFRYALFSA